MTSQTTPIVITRRNISTINVNDVVGKVVLIERRLIVIPHERARSICPEEVLNEIRRVGIRTPIHVYYASDFQKFILVDGECRLKAVNENDCVPAIVLAIFNDVKEAVKRARVESLVYSDKSLSSAQSIFELLEDLYNEVCPNVKEIKIECCRKVAEEIERITNKKLSENTIKKYLQAWKKAKELNLDLSKMSIREAIEKVRVVARVAKKTFKISSNSTPSTVITQHDEFLIRVERYVLKLINDVNEYVKSFGVTPNLRAILNRLKSYLQSLPQ